MDRILTAQQTKDLELCAARSGISHFELMERAGTVAARFLIFECDARKKSVLVLCGNGNNGGDGFVIARHLAQNGATVKVLQVKGEPKTPDAATMKQLAQNEGVVVCACKNQAEIAVLFQDAQLIVDAIYGIGFHGQMEESVVRVIQAANQSAAYRVAIDLPSGTECDTANIAQVSFQADETLTFSSTKPVHWHMPAQAYCGRVTVLSLEIPQTLFENINAQAWVPDLEWAKTILPKRNANSNKGTFGRALCICGSYGMAGAAILSAFAALRCGAGLVHLAVPRSVYPLITPSIWEAVYTPLPESKTGAIAEPSAKILQKELKKATACLIGCGIGTEPQTVQTVGKLLQTAKLPIVLDADGINAIAEHKDILKTGSTLKILTPHPGEMARLVGKPVSYVQSARSDVAAEFAAQYGVYLVLKGHHTVIASPDGRQWVNPTGNAGMARGGSGDVLSGMIVAFLAQGMKPEDASVLAVWLHGAAGDRCAKKHSQTAMQVHQLLDELPNLFLELEQRS